MEDNLENNKENSQDQNLDKNLNDNLANNLDNNSEENFIQSVSPLSIDNNLQVKTNNHKFFTSERKSYDYWTKRLADSQSKKEEQISSVMRMRVMMDFTTKETYTNQLLDEIEDIVKRNTQEFQSELESLFEQARSELTEELQEVLRMAYERRRQLHLAALAAGRVQSSVVSNFNQMSLIKKTPATVNGGGGGGGGNGKNNKNGGNNNNNSRGTTVPVFSSSDTGKDMRDELKQLEGGSGGTTASRSSKLSQIKE